MSQFDSKTYLPPLLLIFIPFIVYQSTIGPIVYLGDSGELTTAAFSLGIPHGSGYPLYTLLGKIFCLIPIGNVGFRMNLMSVFFALATLWLVYSLISCMTASKLSALVGAFILGFVSVFWFQTVAAEVYALHTFFVALLLRILWWWDERREFSILILFVFVTGISFGNHLQTVMLAPAVLFLILSGDKRVLFNPKRVIILSIFFIVALSIYLYLPIRTDAGAAIHWGDPNTLERFLAHVSGKAHREGYVLNKSLTEYLVRAKETLWFVWSQLSVILLFSLWGWIKLSSRRWRVFCVLMIGFDFIYAIFLNIISLEITPFLLPTILVLTMLAGLGIGDLLKKVKSLSSVRVGSHRLIRVACFLIPMTFMVINYDQCNQSRNYTAYEQAVNIFRTMGKGGILLIEGDNNFFPVVYGRIVERMREDLLLFDRQNLIYKLPYLGEPRGYYFGDYEGFRIILEKNLLAKMWPMETIYAVFDSDSVILPAEYAFVPYGILYRVVKREKRAEPYRVRDVWRYYTKESINDGFERDYLNRQVSANFYFKEGRYLIMAGNPKRGLEYFRKASQVGYNDTDIHLLLAKFFTKRGAFQAAKLELEKSMVYHRGLGVVYNNWGIYHYRRGDFKAAIESFQKAIRISPKSFRYYKNLGHAMYQAGRREDAVLAFKESLAIFGDQPIIIDFMKKNDLK